MALLFMDSFDHYVTADLTEKWTSTVGAAAAISAGNGRRSTASLRLSPTSNGNFYAAKTVVPGDATAVLGFAFKTTTFSTVYSGVAAIFQGGSAQITLKLDTDLRLSVLRGTLAAGTTLGTTADAAVTLGVAAHIELKVLIDPTVGTVDLRVNGATVLALTGQNTRATATSAWDALALGTVGGTGSGFSTLPTQDYDDLYVLDGTGSAPWNTVLGDCRVDVRNPTGAGTTTGWTPSTGSNYQNVDDSAPDDDSTYNTAASVLTDTFVVEDAPVAGATIYGVQHNLYAKKSDAGTCTIAPVVRHSSTDYVGSDLSPATAYAFLLAVQQVNPGTSAQWTEAHFNAAEFGCKKTA